MKYFKYYVKVGDLFKTMLGTGLIVKKTRNKIYFYSPQRKGPPPALTGLGESPLWHVYEMIDNGETEVYPASMKNRRRRKKKEN